MENTINGDIMKKMILIICIIVFFCFSLVQNEDEQIRIRIIANSNTNYDQQVKKELVYYLYEKYNFDFDSLEQCDDYISINFSNIKNDLIYNFGNVEVTYTNHIFYNKTYNNIVSDNEEYKTLLIEIGSANGENFWGVLYSENFIENEDTIKYNSYLFDLFKKGE